MSRERPVRPGDVLLAAIAENIPPGSEQQGTRPVVVVANPLGVGPVRFDVIVIVPLTTATGPWVAANPVLYPRLEAGQGGLPQRSTVLIDQVQSIDVGRVRKFYGALDADAYRAVRQGLEQLFGF